MSVSVILIGVVIVIGIGLWMYFGGESEGGADTQSMPASFRCKVCGTKSPTFVAAHEHASAEHDLAGHKIDAAIEAE